MQTWDRGYRMQMTTGYENPKSCYVAANHPELHHSR